MGNDGNIIMDKGVVAEKLDLDGKQEASKA